MLLASASGEAKELSDSFADVCAKFALIHALVVRENESLRQDPRFRDEIETYIRARQRQGSMELPVVVHPHEAIEDALSSLMDQSIPSSEQSQPPVERSQDVYSSDADSAVGDFDTVSVQQPALVVSVDNRPQQPQLAPTVHASQDVDKSEAQPDGSEGDPRDPNRNDSEDSVLSGHSSSRTPPAKPLRVVHASSASMRKVTVPNPDEVVVVDGDEEEEARESVQTGAPTSAVSGSEKQVNSDDGADDKTDEQEEEAKVGGDAVRSEDDVSAAGGGATDATAALGGDAEDAEDEESRTTNADARNQDKSAGPDSTGVATEQQQQEPPQRWLPTLTHDESLDSQANESTGIFDDETQLSQ